MSVDEMLLGFVAMVTAVGGQGTFHEVQVVPGDMLPVGMTPYTETTARYMELCALLCLQDRLNCGTINYHSLTESCELLMPQADSSFDPDIQRYLESGAMVMFLQTSQNDGPSDTVRSTTGSTESDAPGESTTEFEQMGATTHQLGTTTDTDTSTVEIQTTGADQVSEKLTSESLSTMTTTLFASTVTTVPFVPTTNPGQTTVPFVPPTTPGLATEGPNLWRASGDAGNSDIDCTFESSMEFPTDGDRVEMPTGECCASENADGGVKCHATPWPCCKAERCTQPCPCQPKKSCRCGRDTGPGFSDQEAGDRQLKCELG